jgi:hypothetical protein
MEELDIEALQAQLEAVQATGTVNRLNERNCVEIVMYLVEQGKLDVINTMSNFREFLTRKQLGLEIKDEILAHGGRVALTELQSAINVDITHIDAAVAKICEEDPETIVLGGSEIVTDWYLDNIAAEASLFIEARGQCTVADLASRFDLPVAFMERSVRKRCTGEPDSAIAAQMRGQRLFTSAFVSRHESKVRGAFSALTRPVEIDDMVERHGLDADMTRQALKTMLRKNAKPHRRLMGELKGRVFTPSIFAANQRRLMESFFRDNGFIEKKRAKRLQVARPAEYLRKAGRFGDVIELSGVVLAESALAPLQAAAEELSAAHAEAQIPNSVVSLREERLGLPAALTEADLEHLASTLVGVRAGGGRWRPAKPDAGLGDAVDRSGKLLLLAGRWLVSFGLLDAAMARGRSWIAEEARRLVDGDVRIPPARSGGSTGSDARPGGGPLGDDDEACIITPGARANGRGSSSAGSSAAARGGRRGGAGGAESGGDDDAEPSSHGGKTKTRGGRTKTRGGKGGSRKKMSKKERRRAEAAEREAAARTGTGSTATGSTARGGAAARAKHGEAQSLPPTRPRLTAARVEALLAEWCPALAAAPEEAAGASQASAATSAALLAAAAEALRPHLASAFEAAHAAQLKSVHREAAGGRRKTQAQVEEALAEAWETLLVARRALERLEASARAQKTREAESGARSGETTKIANIADGKENAVAAAADADPAALLAAWSARRADTAPLRRHALAEAAGPVAALAVSSAALQLGVEAPAGGPEGRFDAAAMSPSMFDKMQRRDADVAAAAGLVARAMHPKRGTGIDGVIEAVEALAETPGCFMRVPAMSNKRERQIVFARRKAALAALPATEAGSPERLRSAALLLFAKAETTWLCLPETGPGADDAKGQEVRNSIDALLAHLARLKKRSLEPEAFALLARMRAALFGEEEHRAAGSETRNSAGAEALGRAVAELVLG